MSDARREQFKRLLELGLREQRRREAINLAKRAGIETTDEKRVAALMTILHNAEHSGDDDERVAELLRLLASASADTPLDPETTAELAALRETDPQMYEALAVATRPPDPLANLPDAETSAVIPLETAPAEIIARAATSGPPHSVRDSGPPATAVEHAEAAARTMPVRRPLGAPGAAPGTDPAPEAQAAPRPAPPLFPAGPVDPRHAEVRRLYESSRKLQRQLSSWRDTLDMYGEVAGYALILRGMGDGESAEEFLARCVAGHGGFRPNLPAPRPPDGAGWMTRR